MSSNAIRGCTVVVTGCQKLRTPGSAADDAAALPVRDCAWCAAPIIVECRPGRPRLYCNHACRQRAYEHRHGFLHCRTVRTLPGQAPGEVRHGSGYERGGFGVADRKVHAMRTSVRPEGRRRQTLCGALALPMTTVTGRYFSAVHPQACKVCVASSRANPLQRPISVSNELSRLRALIDEVAEQRVAPDLALAWMIANQMGGRPAPTPPQRQDQRSGRDHGSQSGHGPARAEATAAHRSVAVTGPTKFPRTTPS